MTNKPMLSVERLKFLVELLGGVAGAAFRVADDSEERDEEGSRIHVVGGADFDVLERALDACDELPDLDDNYVRDGWLRALDELRALLDKPVQPPVADLLLASAHSYVKLAGETQNLARHLQSRIEVYFDGEPAAQNQGEPVAICRLWNEGGSGERTSVEFIGESCADGTLLYAEQPAPIAVGMPEHTMRSVMDAIQQARGFPVLTSNQCHALAESLNYVVRLNGVKP